LLQVIGTAYFISFHGRRAQGGQEDCHENEQGKDDDQGFQHGQPAIPTFGPKQLHIRHLALAVPWRFSLILQVFYIVGLQ
jgi:hypothetical protein